MKKVLILGAYGQHNLGDEALLEVFLRQFADWEVIVNSARPSETEKEYGVKTVPTYRFGWPRFRRLRAILSADLLVFGGGSLLKELEGGPVVRSLYLLRIVLVLVLARLAGRRVAMLGVGIGPLSHPFYKLLSRLAARLPDLICVRDKASAELLREIGVRRPVHVTADVVLLYQGGLVTPEPDLVQLSEPVVVVIPRYTLTEHQLSQLAQSCDRLIESAGVRLIVLPFQTGYIKKFEEKATVERFVTLLQHPAKAQIVLPSTPAQLVTIFKQASLVLSCRLHGLVFGAKAGIPIVGLDYEVKVRNFMQEIGQHSACLSLAELEAGDLTPKLQTVWADREAIGEAVRSTLQPLTDEAGRTFELLDELKSKPASGGLLRGGAMLFASMTIVNAGNYFFNLLLGRWLGPDAFAELSLIITMFLIITFFTSTFQTVAARFSAMYSADENQPALAGVRNWLSGRAWVIGLTLAVLFCIGLPFLLPFFHTDAPLPFVLLAACIPFYLAQGVDRGILQGQTRFGLLSLSYQAEMWVRLLLALALVALGLSVDGAVTALLVSVIATWLVANRVKKRLVKAKALGRSESRSVINYAAPVSLALIGQILINNSDILIVKHFFDANQAGLYASVALIGRIVFFATWSVVTTLFPIVAQRERKGLPHRHLLTLGLVLVGSVSGLIIVATLIAPGPIMQILFGDAYIPAANLLAPYALATALYALGNVIINYRLSIGAGGGSLFGIMAGIVQVAGLWFFHQTLTQVVQIQIFVMAGMLALLVLWDVWLVMGKKLSFA